jgi:hypothetical protein
MRQPWPMDSSLITTAVSLAASQKFLLAGWGSRYGFSRFPRM